MYAQYAKIVSIGATKILLIKNMNTQIRIFNTWYTLPKRKHLINYFAGILIIGAFVITGHNDRELLLAGIIS